MKFVQKSIRLPGEVWMRLEAAAKVDGISVSNFLRRMLHHNLGASHNDHFHLPYT